MKTINVINKQKEIRPRRRRGKGKNVKRQASIEDMLEDVSDIANNIAPSKVKSIMRAFAGECFYDVPMCLNDEATGNRLLDTFRGRVAKKVAKEATKSLPRNSKTKVRSYGCFQFLFFVFCFSFFVFNFCFCMVDMST